MAELEIRLLGPFQVRLGAETITDFESNKVRALLAYLAMENGNSHYREKMVDLFWPELPPKRASSNLSQAVYNLRRSFGDQRGEPSFFMRSRVQVGFNPQAAFWLDVHEFTALMDGDVPQDPIRLASDPGQIERLQAGIDLYRGDFLEGLAFDSSVAFDEWLLVVRRRLQQLALNALHTLAETYTHLGQIPEALSYARRRVVMDPLDEIANRQLIRLLEANGQRNQALTQFERLRLLLSEELGIEPEHETLKLRDQIRTRTGSAAGTQKRLDNLPAFISPLVGRRDELAYILGRLESLDCRLLTILGPGGSGKTRLGLEAARDCRLAFRDGVVFVALNPLDSSAPFTPAIMDALKLPRLEGEDPDIQLANYLRDKNLLLVLDGFEHLLTWKGLVWDLLRGAPKLKVLVTSRIRLNIKSEHIYPLFGMRFPSVGVSEAKILEADAVQLLVSCLERVQPGYQPDSGDLVHLLQICHHLQGMPLGILLAASWGATFSLEEISDRVSRTLDFLSADWADVPARQRSLRATCDHTWALLGERERGIFPLLSVFRGAFTRQAARHVCGANPQALRELVDHSLLENSTPGWYQVHELLRQYSREKLALSSSIEQSVCNRHSAYYLDQLVHLGGELKSEAQVAALSMIDLEHENYRVAWNWIAGQGSVEHLIRVLDAFCLYYDLSLRYTDGEDACRIALEGLPENLSHVDVSLLRGRLLIWKSRFTRLLGRVDEASGILKQVPALLDSAKERGNETTSIKAFLLFEQGENYVHHDRGSAIGYYHQSLKIYRNIEDTWGVANALAGLGYIAHHAGTFQESLEIYSECLDLHRTLGDPRGIANTLIHLGQNSLRLGQVKNSEKYIGEGVAILEQIGDRAGAARGYFEFGRFYYWRGEFTRALDLVEKSIPIFDDLGILDYYIFAIVGIGLGLAHLGRYTETISRVLANIPLAQELDARREIGLGYTILGMAALGQRDFKQAEEWAQESVKQYQEINQQEELCLALAVLAYTKLGLDQIQEAWDYLREMLEIGIDTHGVFPVVFSLLAVSLLLVKQGDLEMAVEFSTLAEGYKYVENSCWFEDIAGKEIAAAIEKLSPEVIAVARERGKERDLWKTAEELLREFQVN